MKFFSAIAALTLLFGCGILSLIFGLPERYIERDVKADEIIGTWEVTSKSEIYVNIWVEKHPNWGMRPAWKTFTLNQDGSCAIEIEPDWLGNSYSDAAIKNMTACLWDLDKQTNLSGKISPVLEFTIEYPGNHSAIFSFYIFEQDDEIIIWDFIGDPDDFRLRDFMKVEQ